MPKTAGRTIYDTSISKEMIASPADAKLPVKSRSWEVYADRLILLLLPAACYLLFFHRLGDIGLIGPDEPRYAAVAREMYLTGDYITPRLHGVPWFEKPPLMYWGAALAYRVFGLNEFAVRFPSAFAATLCVMLVYWCGRRLWDRTVGFFAALMMASSIGFFAFARAASMDMPLTACLTMALVFFLFGYNDGGPRRRWWFYAFYASMGLGALAKGPVAYVLPMIALIAFMLIRNRTDEWRTWHPEAAWISVAIALPWYLGCALANGTNFLKIFFINQNLQRFASAIHGHDRPIYFYLPVFLLLTFPWTFLLIPTLRRRFGRNEQIMAWWAFVPFLIFSLSGSKLPGYILPVVPPIAMLCAKELWMPSSRTFKVAVFIEAGTMIFIGVAFGFFGSTLNIDPHVSGVLIAGTTFALAVLLAAIALWLTPSFLAGFNVVAILIIVFIATNFVFPRFDKTDTMRPWERALEQIVSEDQEVFLYKPARWMEYGLQFYRYDKVRPIHSPEELVRVTSAESRVLCIAEDKSLDELARLGSIDIQVVHTIGNQISFWAWESPGGEDVIQKPPAGTQKEGAKGQRDKGAK
jgi:4-amino-4-deoxy-L-arabinose transferase-like glycosyltransferase